jgi:hypothetical protein
MRRASWNRLLVWAVGALTFLVAPLAHAEGPGIKLGDRLLLHLGLAAEFRYDDNAFFQAKSQNPAGGFQFRLLPSVDLATRQARDGSGMVDFRLHAGMAYSEFITNREVLEVHRSFGVDAGALLTLWPGGRFNLSFFDNYVRTTQLPYGPEIYNLDRDTNQLGVRMQYSPGGRRLILGLTYVFGIDFFERDTFQAFNLFTHSLALNISWKFFPKTALYLQASETVTRYQNHSPSSDFDQPDSNPFHIELGVMGLITPKLSANAWIGYGNGFYVYNQAAIAAGKQVDAGSPSTAVGGLSFTWKPTLLSTGSIGYKFDYANSLVGAYYNAHQTWLSWTQLIWRFSAFLRLGYQNIQYFGVPPVAQSVPNGDGRRDNFINFDLRVDYPFKPWLVASLGYDLQYNDTSAKLITMPMTPTIGLIPLNYLKNEVWLRLSVLY